MPQRARFRRNLLLLGGLAVAASGGAFWWFNPFQRGAAADARDLSLARTTPQPQLALNTPVGQAGRHATPRGAEEQHLAAASLPAVPASRPASQQAAPATRPALTPLSQPAAAQAPAALPAAAASAPVAGDPRLAAAQRKIEAGQLLEARQELNALLAGGELRGSAAAEARTLLAGVADQTVFARKLTAGDPAQESYTIQPGDRLIHIARKLDVPHEILMEINKIADAGTIRADQKIKLIRGPFHARIYKSAFRLDLYLGDLYVRSYAVGLGADPGTPEGTWKVKDRLSNPTYYPSASATEKRIIPPDDPENPLGEHWIGLEGVDGEAVGHDGYGIHGTIEPESIGKAVSLGCVRMHNEDVAFVYKCLLPGKSTVTVLP